MHALDRLPVGQMHREQGFGSCAAQHLANRDPDVTTRGDLAALGPLGLHGGHHVAIHAHTGSEHRPALAAVHQSDPPPRLAPAVRAEQADQLVGGLDGVRTDAQCSGEDIGRAAGHHRNGGQVARRRAVRPRCAQQSVDHFVHRAVAAVHDDHVGAVAAGGLGDLDGVAAMVGVGDDEFHPALQGVGQQVAAGRGRRRGVRVHDQHGAHER